MVTTQKAEGPVDDRVQDLAAGCQVTERRVAGKQEPSRPAKGVLSNSDRGSIGSGDEYRGEEEDRAEVEDGGVLLGGVCGCCDAFF